MVVPSRTRRVVSGAIVTVVAVVLLQSRLGERASSETSAISALSGIRAAEVAYASNNRGYYDTLTCLHSGTCIPGLTERFAMFQTDIVTRQEWRGYRFEFHAGPSVTPAIDERVSQTSMTRFAVVAFPINVTTTSRRSFCVDDRQTIYAQNVALPPKVVGARCLDTSNPLQ